MWTFEQCCLNLTIADVRVTTYLPVRKQIARDLPLHMIKNAGQLVALAPEEAQNSDGGSWCLMAMNADECAQRVVVWQRVGYWISRESTGPLTTPPIWSYVHGKTRKGKKKCSPNYQRCCWCGMSKADEASFTDCLVS